MVSWVVVTGPSGNPAGVVRVKSFELGELPVHNRLFLPFLEHDGQYYVGSLLFDDSAICSKICALLQLHLGRSIKDIGDLDVI